MENVELKSQQYNCKNCGSVLLFDPNTKSLMCDKCNSHFEMQITKNFKRHQYQENFEESKTRDEWINDNKVFKCKNCGGSIVANKYEMSNTCPYCNTNLAVDSNNLPGLKPDAIIPFAFDKEKASQKFVENVRKKFYVSGKFKKHLPSNKIRGTYVPSFVFDMKTQSSYNGTLSRSERQGDHTFTTSFNINGTLNKKYSNVMIESSSQLKQYELNAIMPFDMSTAVDYQNGFILGYTVEYYAEKLKTCEEIARQTVASLIRKDILSKYTYDSVDELSISTKYDEKDYNYILLPVYKFEYDYKNKPFKTYMNGQNGKIDNNLPKSIPKIVMTVLIVILIILIPIILSLIGD